MRRLRATRDQVGQARHHPRAHGPRRQNTLCARAEREARCATPNAHAGFTSVVTYMLIQLCSPLVTPAPELWSVPVSPTKTCSKADESL
jgi:hypothetical protein